MLIGLPHLRPLLHLGPLRVVASVLRMPKRLALPPPLRLGRALVYPRAHSMPQATPSCSASMPLATLCPTLLQGLRQALALLLGLLRVSRSELRLVFTRCASTCLPSLFVFSSSRAAFQTRCC